MDDTRRRQMWLWGEGGYLGTEHQPAAGGQPSSFWQTVTGGVR